MGQLSRIAAAEMKDMLAQLEKLHTQAAECEMIRDINTLAVSRRACGCCRPS
jgi:hypothetical protein